MSPVSSSGQLPFPDPVTPHTAHQDQLCPTPTERRRPLDPVRKLSLVHLSREMARALGDIGRIAVEGEVVEPKVLSGGSTYFTLRDRAVQIGVFAPSARSKRCRVVQGEKVSVTGRLDYTPARGLVQLRAEEVIPVGEGAIAAAIAEVRERLRNDGILVRPRRSIPRLPRAVGVVCGAEAAVRGDIESVVADKFPGFPLVVREVSVGGPGAAESIIEGLGDLESNSDVEVVILARGGGGAAELLPFSDEELCRALAACRVPVVSAVGHHDDRPLCDEVADLRCSTPSLAAEAVIPDRVALGQEIGRLLTEGLSGIRFRLTYENGGLQRLDPTGILAPQMTRAGHELELADPVGGLGARMQLAGQHLERSDPRVAGLTLRLAMARQALEEVGRTMEALDPARVLARGYAVVRRADDGAVVRDPIDVAEGEQLDLQVAKGRIGAVVAAVAPARMGPWVPGDRSGGSTGGSP